MLAAEKEKDTRKEDGFAVDGRHRTPLEGADAREGGGAEAEASKRRELAESEEIIEEVRYVHTFHVHS